MAEKQTSAPDTGRRKIISLLPLSLLSILTLAGCGRNPLMPDEEGGSVTLTPEMEKAIRRKIKQLQDKRKELGPPEKISMVVSLDELTVAGSEVLMDGNLRGVFNRRVGVGNWSAWENYSINGGEPYGLGVGLLPGMLEPGMCWVSVDGVQLVPGNSDLLDAPLRHGSVILVTDPWNGGNAFLEVIIDNGLESKIAV